MPAGCAAEVAGPCTLGLDHAKATLGVRASRFSSCGDRRKSQIRCVRDNSAAAFHTACVPLELFKRPDFARLPCDSCVRRSTSRPRVGDDRNVDADRLAEIVGLVDVRRDHAQRAAVRQQTAQRRRRNQLGDDLLDVRAKAAVPRVPRWGEVPSAGACPRRKIACAALCTPTRPPRIRHNDRRQRLPLRRATLPRHSAPADARSRRSVRSCRAADGSEVQAWRLGRDAKSADECRACYRRASGERRPHLRWLAAAPTRTIRTAASSACGRRHMRHNCVPRNRRRSFCHVHHQSFSRSQALRWILRGAGVLLALYVLLVVCMMWWWSYEPDQFDVDALAHQRAAAHQQRS